MATGNINDDKVSRRNIASISDKTLAKNTEASIKKIVDKGKKGAKEISDLFDKGLDNTVGKFSKSFSKVMKNASKEFALNLADSAITALNSGYGAVDSGVTKFLDGYAQYYSNIQTRMLGTGKQYEDMLTSIKNGVTGSKSTNVLAVLNKLNKLVESGIAYNVEQRAFLDTLSEKIATTFDATNGTLLQLIRLNRTDSTAAYLGMEAALTEYLNSTYSDSRYLTSDLNSAVSSALYEATSQLGKEEGAEFEYAAQKWLGSFYSSGVNESTIQSIAQAIGYLGSGNTNALTSNSQLNNLIASAANFSGLNYSDLLTSGINSDDANTLLKGIYQQAVTMASSGDKVAQSQYAQLFGMTLSDLTAIMNMTSSDLLSISANMYSYGDLIAKTEYELSQVASRTSVKEAIDNTISNIMAEIGDGIATNTASYVAYTLGSMIEGSVQIPIPFIGQIDLGTTMKAAVLGMNVISSMGGIFAALSENKTLSLANFSNLDNYGSGFVSSVGASTMSRTSGATSYYGTSDSNATAVGTVASMKESTSETVSSYDTEESKDIDDLYNELAILNDKIDSLFTGANSITIKKDNRLD